jgi:hypothetical protein
MAEVHRLTRDEVNQFWPTVKRILAGLPPEAAVPNDMSRATNAQLGELAGTDEGWEAVKAEMARRSELRRAELAEARAESEARMREREAARDARNHYVPPRTDVGR